MWGAEKNLLRRKVNDMWKTDEKIIKPARKYFSEDLNVENWDEVEKILKDMEDETITSEKSLRDLIKKECELSGIISEKMARLYIDMTRFADQKEKSEKFNAFYSGVVSRTEPYSFRLKKKIAHSEYLDALPEDEFAHYIRIIKNDMEIFREENIPLKVKENELSNKYGAINSRLTVEFDGEEKTLSQLSVYFKDKDRTVREKAWRMRTEAMARVKEELDTLFDEMKALRHEQALNAGFENYRDYKHKAMGRFAYTPEDLHDFHRAVEEEVVPFLRELSLERKETLGLDKLRPWDTEVDLGGNTLKPFENATEFVEKAVKVLSRVDEQYGKNLNMMYNSGLLDLENRKGKAPGGYNYPLMETGAPFIFMNAVGLQRDVVTLLHESGHAMHTFASRHVDVSPYQHTPSEVAELASMAMELLTMEQWDEYYSDEESRMKAMRDELEGTLKFLPWCMVVDAFQHWIYTNPGHTVKERDDYFMSLMKRYDTGVDWSGLEEEEKLRWLFQLHIFEVPFYYIEYGMAQLGALSIYRNYRTGDKKKAVKSYDEFLKLAYTRPVNQLYGTAGVQFKFTGEHIADIVDFVKSELKSLK